MLPTKPDKQLSVTLDQEGLTEAEKLELVSAYFALEQSHVKQEGREAMQKDLIKTYNEALNSG